MTLSDWLVIYLWLLGGFLYGAVMVLIRMAENKSIGLWHCIMIPLWPIAMPLGMLKHLLGGGEK